MSVLPDVLKRDLKVVFCGTAAGEKSAKVGAYFAGKGNQFWDILFRVRLTPRKFNPHEFRSLLKYGIGLTDLAKMSSGIDSYISSSDFDIGSLRSKIKKFKPKVLAFNGKRAAKVFLRPPVKYGLQSERIGRTVIFVLPSTSGSARKYWKDSYWKELADFLKSQDVFM